MKNKKAFLLLSFLFILLTQVSWSQLKRTEIGASQMLTSVTLLNKDTIHVTGYDGLFRSVDGGVSWIKLSTSSETSYFTDIYFSDRSNGLAVGPITGEDSYVIGKTSNGGATWEDTEVDNSQTFPRRYNDIEFLDENTGFAVGTNGKIIYTEDGGTSWSVAENSNTAHLLKVDMHSITNGFILAPGYVARFNGIAAGNSVVLNTSNDFVDLANVNGQFVFALSTNRIYRSVNTGTTWQRLDLPFQGANCLYVHNEDTLYVGSASGLYLSTDRGVSWGLFKETENIPITDILATPEGDVYAASNEGVLFIGTDFGGAPAPVLRFFVEFEEECGYTNLVLNNESSPDLAFKWVYNNEVVSEKYIDTLRFTEDAVGTIYLVGSNGANADTLSIDFELVVSPITADAGPDIYACYDEPVRLKATGGVSYSWTPEESLDNPYDAEPISVFGAGTVKYIVAIDNGLNCIAYDTVSVIRGDPLTPYDWQEVTTTSQFPVKTLKMVTPTLGYAISPNSLLITNDGGSTWENDPRFADTGITNSTFTTDLEVLSADTMLVLNDNLYRTSDGGDSYDLVAANMIDIEFVNKSIGFGLSYVAAERSQVVKTVDGGITWTPVSDVYIGWLYNLDCRNSTSCVAVGGNEGGLVPLLVYTTDGETWQEGVIDSGTGSVTDVEFTSDGTAFAVSSSGQVLKTINGGEYWYVDYTMSSLEDLASITMLDSQKGFIGSKNGNLYQTVNGGECWQPMGMVSEAPINAIFANDTVAFISTASVNESEGKIFRADIRLQLSYTLSSASACVSEEVVLKNTSIGISSFILTVNEQEVPFSDEVIFSFPNAGEKVVTLQGSTPSGAILTSTRIITVSGGTIKPVIDEGLFTLSSTLEGEHEWYLDDLLLPEKSATLTPAVSGSYKVRVMEGTCPSLFSEAVSFTVKSLMWTGETSYCAGETFTISNTSSGFDSYEWKWNGSVAGTTTNLEWSEVQAGTYTLTLIGKSGNITDQLQKEIVINPVPSAASVNLGADQTLESGDAITLQTPTEFSTYSWSNGLTTRSIRVVADNLPEGPSTFSVTVTDANGCQNSDDILITNIVVTGTEKYLTNFVSVYPNPIAANQVLTLSGIRSNGMVQIRLRSVNGSVVMKTTATIDEIGEVRIPMVGLSAGIYVVELMIGSQRFSSRLIVK